MLFLLNCISILCNNLNKTSPKRTIGFYTIFLMIAFPNGTSCERTLENSMYQLSKDINSSIPASERSLIPTTFSTLVDSLVEIINAINNVLNANTTIESLNKLTNAATNLFQSNGWVALDNLANTMGNSFQIYDAIASAIDRIKHKKHNANENENENEKLERWPPSRKYYKTKRKKNPRSL